MKPYLLFDLSDDRTSALADVISNKTCKRILTLLAEQDLSESELASTLKLPLTTVHYNVQKLVKTGLIEKTRDFWSSRGKKVPVYRASEKRIMISPRSKQKTGILPAIIATALGTLGVYWWQGRQVAEQTLSIATKAMPEATVAAPVAPAGPDIASGGSAAMYASDAPSASSAIASSASDFARETVSNATRVISKTTEVISQTPSDSMWKWFLVGGLVVVLALVINAWIRGITE